MPLDVRRLRYPRLNATRRRLVRDLRALSKDQEASIKALKLGPRQLGEVSRNRAVASSATMPAIDRYTGVVFDALDAPTLSAGARAFAGEHLVIQSALLGPVGALDPIPAYRLSHDSRLPGIQLAKTWAPLASRELAAGDGLILDFRSEAYAAMGPVAGRSNCFFLRVVTESPDGSTRALNHFNKKSKGLLTRALLQNAQAFSRLDELLAWAENAGVRLGQRVQGELELVIDAPG